MPFTAPVTHTRYTVPSSFAAHTHTYVTFIVFTAWLFTVVPLPVLVPLPPPPRSAVWFVFRFAFWVGLHDLALRTFPIIDSYPVVVVVPVPYYIYTTIITTPRVRGHTRLFPAGFIAVRLFYRTLPLRSHYRTVVAVTTRYLPTRFTRDSPCALQFITTFCRTVAPFTVMPRSHTVTPRFTLRFFVTFMVHFTFYYCTALHILPYLVVTVRTHGVTHADCRTILPHVVTVTFLHFA